jgi:iron complex outermembrane receptor protein
VVDTFTFGVVIDLMDDMQISIDYGNSKSRTLSTILIPRRSSISVLCLGVCATPSIVALVAAFGLGRSSWVEATNINLGGQHWQGIDLAWNWGLDAWGGNWNFDLIGTYMLKKETTPIPDDPTSTYDCAGVISPVCYPNPDWRHTATATYDSSSWWAITGRWRYYGKVKYEGTTDQIANDNLGAQNYLDLNAVFRFMETHDLVIGVNNVFDKEPPLVGNTLSWNGNTIPGFYDTLGRYLFANMTLRW